MPHDSTTFPATSATTKGQWACPHCGGAEVTQMTLVYESGSLSDDDFIAHKELNREMESRFCSQCLVLC